MLEIGTITDQADMDFEKALEFIKGLGMEYVELHALWNKNIEELNDEEISEARKLLGKYGLKTSLISSTLFLQCHLFESKKEFRPIDDYFITIAGDYGFHMRALERCIKLCDVFNTDKIRIFGFIKEDPTIDEDRAVEKVKESLVRPLEMVEKAGLTLVLENCPHTYLQFGSLTSRVIEEIGSKHFRALWDPANAMRSGGKPYPEDYRNISQYIEHVHAKDISLDGELHMVPLGEGVIDYRGIVQSLMNDGFSGVVSLEPESVDEKGGRPEGLRKSYEGIKTILKEIGVP
jgi:sugar phosphate isomerase/epimerase